MSPGDVFILKHDGFDENDLLLGVYRVLRACNLDHEAAQYRADVCATEATLHPSSPAPNRFDFQGFAVRLLRMGVIAIADDVHVIHLGETGVFAKELEPESMTVRGPPVKDPCAICGHGKTQHSENYRGNEGPACIECGTTVLRSHQWRER